MKLPDFVCYVHRRFLCLSCLLHPPDLYLYYEHQESQLPVRAVLTELLKLEQATRAELQHQSCSMLPVASLVKARQHT